MITSTIAIPCYQHPNFLWAALRSLVEHSYYKHRIIVVWSDPARVEPGFGQPKTSASDWVTRIDGDGGRFEQRYTSIKDMLVREAAWLSAHGVENFDITDEYIEFRRGFERDRGAEFHGGVATAFHNNWGLARTDTEWTIPNWDADFYAGWHWDKSIFDYVTDHRPQREYLIPMHAQPALVAEAQIAAWDAWRDSHAISTHRLAIPTSRVLQDTGGSKHPITTREELFAFERKTRRPGAVIREPCGLRRQLHWVPWILRTEDIRAVGNFNYQGPGYDLAFDNAFGERGFVKVGFCDAFIMHKGWPPVDGRGWAEPPEVS